MTKAEAIARLRAHQDELQTMGIEHLSLFGSVARGEEHASSDVDLAARLDYSRCAGLLEFVGIGQALERVLERKVDLISEPARRARMQAEIDRDRVHVF